MQVTPSPGYSITIEVNIVNRPGMLGKVASAIGAAGGDIGSVDLIEAARDHVVRDITVNARDERHAASIVEAVRGVQGAKVINWADRTFKLHVGGKIEVRSRIPVKTRDDLSMAYTPGVARICKAIQEDPAHAYHFTIRKNTVAVVTDGTAVLGLGDIGPDAALPVMEGKALLFKEFGGVDAFPICLRTKAVDEIVRTVALIATSFGGINLEDISAPRCFEVEQRLRSILDIPVFHDDQHGTAVVVLAALLNAVKVVGKAMKDLRVLICGAGAAGTSIAKILLTAGVSRIVVCDRAGLIYRGRTAHMDAMKVWIAENTNPECVKGALAEGLRGADVFLGLSGPGILKVEELELMAKDPIMFALANPVPEIWPEAVAGKVRVIATGRSDYPNQINNVLCFPGMFRGALDVRARTINEEMELAAAHAIAGVVRPEELGEEYIIPSVFDRKVALAVAEAVAHTARETGVAQAHRRPALHPHSEHK